MSGLVAQFFRSAASPLMTQGLDDSATLVASLHAVDLALKWFPRVVGMRGGAIVFDLPTAAVTGDMLRDLYATEGSALPMQGIDLSELPGAKTVVRSTVAAQHCR